MSIDNNNTWSCKVTKTCQLEKKKIKKKKKIVHYALATKVHNRE